MDKRIQLFFLFLLVGVLNGLPYTKDSGVIELTKDNFAQLVFSTEHVWLVEFYAPWCGHCRNLAPEYEKAAKNLKGIVRVAAVNCDEHKELAGAFGVQGFPTIKLFPSKLTPKDGGVHKVPIDYNGPRTAAGLVNFALGQLPSFVTNVKKSSHEKFLSSESDLAKVLLFTDKSTTSNLYKALSVDFHHALVLGQVQKTESDLVEQYGVKEFPTLVVVTTSGEKVTYEGQMKHESLFTFLSKYAKPLKQQTPPESGSSSKKEKKQSPPPEPERNVLEEVTDQATFEKLCSVNCLVSVFDPSNTDSAENEQYLNLLKATNDKHKKFFNFLWIDAAKHPEFINEFNLYSGFPAVVVLNQKKMSYIPFVGSYNDEKLGDFIEGILAGKRASKLSKFPVLSGGEKPKEKTEL